MKHITLVPESWLTVDAEDKNIHGRIEMNKQGAEWMLKTIHEWQERQKE